jgi:hypothetical protein
MKSILIMMISLGLLLAAGIAFLTIPDKEEPIPLELTLEDKTKTPPPSSSLWADNHPSSFPFIFSPPEKEDRSPLQMLLDPKYAAKSPLDAKLPANTGPLQEKTPIEEKPRSFPTFRIVLDPKERTVISSELNTPVAKIYKRMGDAFEPGDLLISLDQRVMEGNYGKAAAKREKARIEWEGKKQL